MIVVGLLIGLIVGALIGYEITPSKVTVTSSLTGVIPIGFLADDDIVYTSMGGKWAVTIAQEDINAYLKEQGIPANVTFITEMAEGSDIAALQKFQSLVAMGCKAVVGFGYTSMVKACKAYADSNNILILSYSSTGMAMAIPNDFIFRFRGSDVSQTIVVARLINDMGIKAIVVLYIGDACGDSYYPELTKQYNKVNGTVIAGIRFSPDAIEFSSEVASLAANVHEAIGKYGKDKVGVALLAYDKHHPLILEAAEDYPELMEVKWFGSDASAYTPSVIRDTPEIGAKVKIYSTMAGSTKTSAYYEFRDKFYAKTGNYPPGFSAAEIYDSCWILVSTMLQVGKYDADAIQKALPHVCASYYGVDGWMKLDANGDREVQDFEIVAILEHPNGTYAWERVAWYTYATDTLQWLP
jgi:branched-chain amino acid transport system substrate-binding protein